MVKKPVWNNARRVNHQNFQRKNHPNLKRNFIPKVVLMKSGLKTFNTARQSSSRAAVSVNTARSINTAYTKPIVNSARPASNVFKRAHPHVRNPFNKFTTNNNSNFNKKVNTVRGHVTTARLKAVNTARPNSAVVNAVRANQGNPQLEFQEKRVINNGCSRHMTGNKSYLSDYEEIDGGFVSFGGNPKGGKITRKDDFSRFSWVFFLATKDETSGILKAFITGIENQINHRVKIIRCDNGTKFKNKEMNQFSEMKGIKREFRVARTPQQNGVAERKNKTLIEAARTMLADSKLPTTFWAKVVNTACYVENRVLVIKPYNKTPYELLLGRKPALSFMRPSSCPVTILNTLDHLGKFDGKADEGLFIRYSVNRNGPEWLFDIDTLTKSMNYKAVVAGNETNGNAGTKESIDIGQAGKKTVPSHKYILLPLWTSDSYISTSLKSSDHEVTDGVAKKSTEDLVKEGDQDDQDLRDEFASEYERLIVQGIFDGAYDDEDFVARGDMNNLESSMLVEKALYSLHQAPRAWVKGDILLVQVYVDDIIFGSTKKELCTEFEKLMHKKFQMSSMASRPDIMFAVCACARFQVTPKVSHLHVVKRIFRYLKGQPKLGLWYSKDLPFDLEAYSDSDYAGTSLNKKSTTGGCQFLRRRLISW
ncbi:putative ribonuclease H-like domain-containing protein [Tanacetum coccineum]